VHGQRIISSVLPMVGVNIRFVAITDTESVSIGNLWQMLMLTIGLGPSLT